MPVMFEVGDVSRDPDDPKADLGNGVVQCGLPAPGDDDLCAVLRE